MAEEKPKRSLIRTIYLYLFTIIGLVLLTIGSVNFVDMALKAWVFRQADEQQRLWDSQPPVPYALENYNKALADPAVTPDQKAALESWKTEYDAWQERRDKIDPVTAQRHRDAAQNLAMILVGLPLYLYHWKMIRKESA